VEFCGNIGHFNLKYIPKSKATFH